VAPDASRLSTFVGSASIALVGGLVRGLRALGLQEQRWRRLQRLLERVRGAICQRALRKHRTMLRTSGDRIRCRELPFHDAASFGGEGEDPARQSEDRLQRIGDRNVPRRDTRSLRRMHRPDAPRFKGVPAGLRGDRTYRGRLLHQRPRRARVRQQGQPGRAGGRQVRLLTRSSRAGT